MTRIQRHVVTTIIANAGTAGISNLGSISGRILMVRCVVPDLTGAGTATFLLSNAVAIADPNTSTIATKGSIAENATTILRPTDFLEWGIAEGIPIESRHGSSSHVEWRLEWTASAGAQTGAKTFTTTLYVDVG